MQAEGPDFDTPLPSATQIAERIHELDRPVPAIELPETTIDDVLRGESNSSRLLTKLLDGDPLCLRAKSCELLAVQARILDPARLHTFSVARVTYGALTASPAAAQARRDNAWLMRCVHHAILDCLLIDERLELERAVLDAEGYASYAIMAELLGIDLLRARAAMLTFNRLALPIRQVCRPVLVRGASWSSLVEAGLGSLEEVRSRFTTGMHAVSNVQPGQVPERAEDEQRSTWTQDPPSDAR